MKSAGVMAFDPPKKIIAQHQEISRRATSRLLVQLMPIPGGFARIHARTSSAKARAYRSSPVSRYAAPTRTSHW
jgi:hypothetical protein